MTRLATIERLPEASLGRNSAGLWSAVTAGLARTAGSGTALAGATPTPPELPPAFLGRETPEAAPQTSGRGLGNC